MFITNYEYIPCTLISEDGEPPTKRLKKPVLKGSYRINKDVAGRHSLVFFVDSTEDVGSPGVYIPIALVETLGDEIRFISEDEGRRYLIKKHV